MKEYKTIKVNPDEEDAAIRCYSTFGWKIEDTREVYNESQEIVGINEKVTPYNSFMQGFTGNSGKVQAQVQTRTNVTHFVSMRFSRETTMKNYDKISALQKEYENIKFEPYYDMPKKPIGMTILGLFGFFSLLLPIGAIASWIQYSSKKKRAISLNELADERNPKLRQRVQEIIKEATKLVEESTVA